MDRKILIAVDHSPAASKAMQYVGALAPTVAKLHVTLLHIQPALSQYLTEEAKHDPAARQEMETLMRQNADDSGQLLADCRLRMARWGPEAERIQMVSLPRRQDLAKDILDYAQVQRQDAIVAGRRGLSRLQSALMGSTTANLMDHSSLLPLWVVDGEVASERILVAVDGSESSLRAVDHLGYIFHGCRGVHFDLFHVIPRLSETCVIDPQGARTKLDKLGERGARHCVDHFYSRAMERFAAAGIAGDQVRLTIAPRMRAAGPGIIAQARKEGYGTVVIGRRGLSPSFFTGSVSRYVINHASNMALWVVP
jgi:nucleotide-binding universal stress UspA family protein